MNRAHPESIALTVAEGKRLCREDRLVAEWSDLLAREIERFADFVKGSDYPTNSPSDESINLLVDTIVARCETLRRLVLVAVRWGTDEAFRITLRGLAALTFSDMEQGGYTWLISLRLLAASMCFHWAVCAAIARADYRRVAQIAALALRTQNENSIAAVTLLPLAALENINWKVLKDFKTHHTPHSDFFSRIFVSEARDIVVSGDDAEQAWDDAEFLIAIESGHHSLRWMKEKGLGFWVPSGRFVWRRKGVLLHERLRRISELASESPELRAGLFGGRPESAKEVAEAASEFFTSMAGRWY